VIVPVSITNTGVAPEGFFVDPRLTTTQALKLAAVAPSSDTVGLPLTTTFLPTWFVPTETSSVSVAQTSTVPAMFDSGPLSGDPDLGSARSGPGPLCTDTASVSYVPPDGLVTAGLWFAAPTECGPYPGPAPKGSGTITMTAQAKAFDAAVTSSTGDIWLASVNPSTVFSPIVVNPGQTGVIDVTITPSGAAGTTVAGDLYVDDFAGAVAPYSQLSGNELAAIPYAYTIGSPT